MFITANESKMFRLTTLASVEALCLSLNATASYSLVAYRWARPRAEKMAYYAVVSGLWTIAFGMACRDWYEILKPRFMAWVDGVVQSGYAPELSITDPSLEVQKALCDEIIAQCEDTDDRPDGTVAPWVCPVPMDVIDAEPKKSILDIEPKGFRPHIGELPKDVRAMTLRELRPYACKMGVKGAMHMSKGRIYEQLGV